MMCYTETDFVSMPVDIETFLTDPTYLGDVVGKELYPYWVDKLKTIFPNPLISPVNEVMLSGSLGSGKTIATCVGVMYELYRLTLLKDPHKKWRILPTTPIQIGVIVSPEKDMLSADLYLDCINCSPYFKSHLLPGKGDTLEPEMFPNHIGFSIIKNAPMILGTAVICSVTDDCNLDFTKWDKQNSDSANYPINIYDSIRRRAITRFMDQPGLMPCRLWVASYKDSRLETLIDKYRGTPGVMVIEPTIWDVHEFKGIYCGKKFLVYLGTETEEPKIIEPTENTYDASLVISVPIEHRPDFEKNIISALKDLAGISPKYVKHWEINKA